MGRYPVSKVRFKHEVFVEEVDLEPPEALRARTSPYQCRLLRLAERGLILDGKPADLLLLRSKQLKNIPTTRDVLEHEMVVSNTTLPHEQLIRMKTADHKDW
jgi:imidazolonepropionase-like amidohydrolase